MPVFSLMSRILVQLAPPSVGLVEAAIAAGAPQRPVGRDEDDLRIARIDHDAADVLASLQADVPPRPAGIVAAIDAVAVADAALVVGFAGADPDRARVLRIDGDRADRIGALVLEDRREGDAGVGGLPHAAGRDADVPGLLVVRVHGDVADAPRHQRRPDRAQAEVGEGAGRPRILIRGVTAALWFLGGETERGTDENEEEFFHG